MMPCTFTWHQFVIRDLQSFFYPLTWKLFISQTVFRRGHDWMGTKQCSCLLINTCTFTLNQSTHNYESLWHLHSRRSQGLVTKEGLRSVTDKPQKVHSCSGRGQSNCFNFASYVTLSTLFGRPYIFENIFYLSCFPCFIL